MKTKICTKCKIKKTLDQFYKEKLGRFGVRANCKKCRDINVDSYVKKRRKNDPEYKKKLTAKTNRYIKKAKKENEIKEYKSNWQKNNKNKVKKNKMTYYKKYKKNPKLKLNGNISSLIRHSLKNNKKGAHWEDLVGYTIEKLKKHLEKHFVKGMTWNNYGKWHVDHKIPMDVFNFTKPEHEDFKKCWALSNLQPLWAEDNLKKHAKIDRHFQPSLLI